jgi:hypothetical protein
MGTSLMGGARRDFVLAGCDRQTKLTNRNDTFSYVLPPLVMRGPPAAS